MPPPLADRTLRKLVADIARAHPDDVDGLLARLSEEHRERVRDLLGAYLGRDRAAAGEAGAAAPATAPASAAVVEPQPVYPDNLSPWLVGRLRGEGEGASGAVRTRMTRAARIALKACAVEAAADLALRNDLRLAASAPARPPRRVAPWRRRAAP